MQLPNGFKDYLLTTMREEVVEELERGLQGEPVVSIRMNGRRASSLQENGVGEPVPWCPDGRYLTERPVFAGDPLWHAGAYYVQEASSMFVAHVVSSIFHHPSSIIHPTSSLFHHPSSPSPICLDLCAAPGGKSTLLRGLLPDNWLLISNEPIRSRAQVLAENMAKWGHPNVIVTNAYASEIAQGRSLSPSLQERGLGGESVVGPLSLILADVPCSGEGMMRKEAEAVAQWSPQLVADCAALQRSIVKDIWPALMPGGILIYSTCTFNPKEDENNVEWIARELGADVLDIPIDPAWGILGDLRKDSKSPLPCYHFIPGRVRGEGFFCAVLRKYEDAKNADFIEESPTFSTNSIESPDAIFADFIEKRESRTLKKKGKKGKDGKQKPPRTIADWIRQQLPTLPTDMLDRPEPDRKTGQVPPIEARIELNLDDAFLYLRGESFTLPSDTPRGIVQVCFQGHRLGLMKNLGTRANNLYPKEWRIRSSYIKPETLNIELELSEQ